MSGEVRKYWLLTSEYPPFYGGGIGTYCVHTAQMYSENGHDVTVFIADKSCKNLETSNLEGIRLIRFNPFFHSAQNYLGYETLTSYAAAETLKIFMANEGRPDVLDCQEYNGLAYFTLLYKHLKYKEFSALTVLVTMHAPSFLYLPYNYVATYRLPYFWIGEMEKFCINAADIVIAPSQYIIDRVKEVFPECNNNIHVVRNPYRNSDSVSEQLKIGSNTEYVFFGKASPLKGILNLLKLFVPIWEIEPQTRLRIIGGTDHYHHPEQCSIDALIRKNYKKFIASGQLVMEGSVTVSNLTQKLSSARAVIIPSVVDNFPYAVLECMNSRKTLLVSDSGGHRELICEGENGFVFSLNNNDSFYEKLKIISTLDSSRLEEIGINAQKKVDEECDYDKIYRLKELVLKNASADTESKFPFLRQRDFKPLQSKANGLLSIVIPYFNLGNYIDETIQSILASSYKNVEIIIVNDGSTDEESISRLDGYKKNSKIRVIHKTNEGLAIARNFGASVASGEFLAFLDADDLIEPGYFGKAISLLSHYSNVFFVGCWAQYFEGSNAVWPCFTPEPPFVLVHNMANTSALVYKKNAFMEAGLNDPAMIFGMEDYDSMLSLIAEGYNGIIIPQTLFNYRVRKNSMARQFNKEKILFLYQTMSLKHIELFRAFGAEVSNLLNANGPGYLYDNPTLDDKKFPGIVGNIIPKRTLQVLKQNRFVKKNIHLIKRIIKN